MEAWSKPPSPSFYWPPFCPLPLTLFRMRLTPLSSHKQQQHSSGDSPSLPLVGSVYYWPSKKPKPCPNSAEYFKIICHTPITSTALKAKTSTYCLRIPMDRSFVWTFLMLISRIFELSSSLHCIEKCHSVNCQISICISYGESHPVDPLVQSGTQTRSKIEVHNECKAFQGVSST